MSQVKNLRAMFENKGDSVSPPERGRTLTPSGSAEASKPLSKVRTNFIAIEKDGRVGLRRDHSGESSVSRRRLSNETTEGAETVATSVPEKPESVTAVDEPIKSLAVESTALPSTPTISRSTSSENPTRPVPAIAPVVSPRKTAPESKIEPAPKATPADNNQTSAAPKSPRKETRETPAKQSVESKTGNRPANLTVSSAAKGPTKPGAKSPSTVKPLASPSLREPRVTHRPISPAAVPPKKVTAASTPNKPASAASSQKPTPSSAARKPPPIHVSPSNNLTSGVGFVKPKPKSPTKPIKLPASLMAQTTASGSKINSTRLSTGSTSVSQTPQSLPRSTSRASTSTTSTLKRQSSTVGRPRPSVGPPPKKTTQEKPAPKKEKQVDEGFLARMMRPTQSSQSKTTDKAPVTPPRKSPAKRASTRQSERSESRARRASGTRRLASRSVSPSRAANPSSAARGPAPEEPITEEMVKAAKEAATKAIPTEPSEQAEAAEPLAVADIKDANESVQETTPAGEPRETQEIATEPASQATTPDTTEPQVSEAPAEVHEPALDATIEVPSAVSQESNELAAPDKAKAAGDSSELTTEEAPAADAGVDVSEDALATSTEQETW
ncbi:hypothetical protein jhhlp_004723 [Lomentospora prolificans]|uniref:Uncharacterized protein n=1 Tax=Lomentospora prolificans TaxID=41688 RepID=A0A2N3N888_9PEZI|nr:hypothetical protein jhhlp_004723 [Lomentospora prolificans]